MWHCGKKRFILRHPDERDAVTAPPPATEQVSPRTRDIDTWPPAEILAALWEGQMAAVSAVQAALPAIAAAAEAARLRLGEDGRLIYCGAGTSGRIGVQDGAELPPTFGWPAHRLVLLMAGGEAAFTRAIEGAEDDRAAAQAAMAAHDVGADDVVLGIAASGATPFTLACLEAAGARGALTIGIANSPGPLLAACAHGILVATGAEAIAGSTRLKAGTAQKIVLNLFSTLLMIRRGHVHQGLMVDMQPKNEKLRLRAARMLRQLSGRDDAAIAAALHEAGGNVKIARLVLEGIDRAAAVAALAAHDGSLTAALEALLVTPPLVGEDIHT